MMFDIFLELVACHYVAYVLMLSKHNTMQEFNVD